MPSYLHCPLFPTPHSIFYILYSTTQILRRIFMHPIEHLAHYEYTTECICRWTAFHYNRKRVTRFFIWKETDHPRVDVLLCGANLGGSCLACHGHEADSESSHRSLCYRLSHTLACDRKIFVRYRDLCRSKFANRIFQKVRSDESASVCDTGDTAQSLQNRDLKTVLPDDRVIGITQAPPFPAKHFCFPFWAGNRANLFIGDIDTCQRPETKQPRILFDIGDTDTFLSLISSADFIKIHIGRHGDCTAHIRPSVRLPVIEH